MDGERIEEEEPQERQRDAVGQRRATPRPLTEPTMSVHSLIQRSRFASISCGRQLERVLRHDRVAHELGRERGARLSREDEHLQRDVLLEWLREHEVDELPRALLVLRAAQDTGELDLAEAAVLDDAGRRLVGRGLRKMTSAGGLDAYDTTIGRFPCCRRRRRIARSTRPPSRRRRERRSSRSLRQ